MKMNHQGSSIEIVREWFGWSTVFATAVSIALIIYTLNWYNNLSPNETLFDFSAPLNAFFQLFKVCFIIAFTYITIIAWFNETHINIDYDKIKVRHKPFPFFGNKTLISSDVDQIYSKKKLHRSSENGTTTVSYEVRVITRNAKDIKLLGSLNSKDQAEYIVQEIKKFLNIKDIR